MKNVETNGISNVKTNTKPEKIIDKSAESRFISEIYIEIHISTMN
jgi:hypothetical protein